MYLFYVKELLVSFDNKTEAILYIAQQIVIKVV
jgi:hypothetical protein